MDIGLQESIFESLKHPLRTNKKLKSGCELWTVRFLTEKSNWTSEKQIALKNTEYSGVYSKSSNNIKSCTQLGKKPDRWTIFPFCSFAKHYQSNRPLYHEAKPAGSKMFRLNCGGVAHVHDVTSSYIMGDARISNASKFTKCFDHYGH